MKIILLKDIKNIGLKGTVKEVNEGYFRNFLEPRQLAVPATNSQVSHVHAQQAKAVQKLESIKESAQSIKAKIDGQILTIAEKAAEGGKLYAAVSSKEIAQALKEQLKVDVPTSAIKMKDSIKSVGEVDIELQLYKDLKANIKVNVTAQ